MDIEPRGPVSLQENGNRVGSLLHGDAPAVEIVNHAGIVAVHVHRGVVADLLRLDFHANLGSPVLEPVSVWTPRGPEEGVVEPGVAGWVAGIIAAEEHLSVCARWA